MQPYNAAFFSLYENVFKTYSELHGASAALKFMNLLFSRGLGKAYQAMGFQKGSTQDFARVVGERDQGVGLRVSFPEVGPDHLIYRFHTDPFPNLKGEVNSDELDRTYLSFKVSFLLGPNWKYETTRHLWKGDEFTEHRIMKCE